MSTVPALAILLSLQQSAKPTVVETRTYEGGNLQSYIRFMVRCKKLEGGCAVYQEDPTQLFGRNRARFFSDGSVILDQPVPKIFKFKSLESGKYMAFNFLPHPYVHFQNLPNHTGEDEVEYDVPTQSSNSVGGFRGSLNLKNGLTKLGVKVEIHPFFENMRVRVAYANPRPKNLLALIAGAVGGKLVQAQTPEQSYQIVPDLEELRSRALATMDYYFPSQPVEYRTRHENMKRFVMETCDLSFLSKWVDAAIKPQRVEVLRTTIEPHVKGYWQAAKKELTKLGLTSVGQWSLEEMDLAPKTLKLLPNFQIALECQLPDGSEIEI
jgi:hypothetical protein